MLPENFKAYFGDKATDEYTEETVKHFRSLFRDSKIDDNEEEGIQIVNAEFSLAYGGRMLLNKTFLRLYKGRRYGLCGRNGAGKSTLMRSIASGKLEGFPDKSELKTCFVEHKLQGSEADLDLVSFIAILILSWRQLEKKKLPKLLLRLDSMRSAAPKTSVPFLVVGR